MLSSLLRLPFATLALLGAALPACGEIRILAVANAATFSPGLPDPGSLAAVFCTGLAGIRGVVRADRFPLPVQLEGVTVTFRGVALPVLAVAELGGYQQVNVQVPWTLPSGDLPRRVAVSQLGQSGALEPVPQSPWGVFFTDARGHAAVQRASDYSAVTPERPARPGELLVVYGTNLGRVFFPPPTGMPADGPTHLILLSGEHRDTRLTVAGLRVPETAGELYLGLTPGLVGVNQVNFRVPVDAPTGLLPLQMVRTRCLDPFGFCSNVTGEASETALLAVRRD